MLDPGYHFWPLSDTLQWRHMTVMASQIDCLFIALFKLIALKPSKVRITGPCITNVFATRRKNFSQWHRSFQRKLLSHWLKFLRHVAITLVIQGPVSVIPWWPMESTHKWAVMQKTCPWYDAIMYILSIFIWACVTAICVASHRQHTLTHLPLVLHICVCESGQHWFR